MKRSVLRKVLLPGSCVAMLLVTGGDLRAARVEFTPAITLTENYFDNSGPAFDDVPDIDYVTEVVPSLLLRGKGARVSASLQYRMQNLIYQGNSDLNKTSNQLLADARTELLRDSLFLDLRSSRSQTIIDPTALVTSENISPNDNRTDVTTYQIVPSFIHRFGDVASFSASVNYADVSYSGQKSSNSESLDYFATLESGEAARRLSWAVSHRQGRLSGDEREDQDYQASLLALGYVMNESLRLIGSTGYEDADVVAVDGKNSGSSWSAGVEWRPMTRTTVIATVGRRFFGDSYLFDLKHEQQRNEWNIRYSEDITNPSRTALAGEVFDTSLTEDTADEGGPQEESTLVTGPDPEVIEVGGAAAIDTGQYLSKMLSAGFIRKTPKTILRIRLRHENRQVMVEDEKVLGADISWALAVGRRTTSVISGEWESQKLADYGGKNDEIWNARLEFIRELGRRSFGKLGLRHAESDAANPEVSYKQNQVTLGVSLRF